MLQKQLPTSTVVILCALIGIIACADAQSTFQIIPNYLLKIFINQDCRYCRFANQQLIELITSEMHWEERLTIQTIDCNLEAHKNQCRDTGKRQLLIILYKINLQDKYAKRDQLLEMEEEGMVKLGQLVGVRSYFYFRDWIKNHIYEVYPNLENDIVDGYQVQKNNYYKQIVKDYELELRRKKKIKADKFNIIKFVKDQIKQIEIKVQEQERPSPERQLILKQKKQQQKKSGLEVSNQGNKNENIGGNQFHGFGPLGNAAIAISLIFIIIMKIQKKSSSNNRYETVNQYPTILISDNDDEDFE